MKTLILAILFATALQADPITIIETLTTSGTLDGTSFNDKVVTITVQGDTTSITRPGTGFYKLFGAASVMVGGVGSDIFTDTISTIVLNPSVIGIEDEDNISDIVDTIDLTLDHYMLNTSLGPLSGPSQGRQGFAFPTVNGSFVIDVLGDEAPSTVTITLGAATPEPASLAFVGASLVGIYLFGRKRITKTN